LTKLQKFEYKVSGGKLVKVQLSKNAGRIQQIKITGDFFLHPETFIDNLEKSLLGQPLDEEKLAPFIRDLFERERIVLLGASAEDFAKCIVMAAGKFG
jgi:lipoate-protein ligase A